MDEKKKAQLIAQAENVEAIKDFFTEWWSVEQLYEAEAKAALALLHLKQLPKVLCDDEMEMINRVLNQHHIMIEHLKPFAERKEDEV